MFKRKRKTATCISGAIFLLLCIQRCLPESFAPKEVLDYIHCPKPNLLFREADVFKYDLDYEGAARLFYKALRSGKINTLGDSVYCLNQLTYINLCMNRDSMATGWLDETDTFIQKHGGISAFEPGAQGDYWYNKGVWGYNTGNTGAVSDCLNQSLEQYEKSYQNIDNKVVAHVRMAQAKTKLGLFYATFKFDSAYTPIMDAFDFFNQNNHNLKKYRAESYLASAVLSRLEREYHKAIAYAIEARKIVVNAPFVDSVTWCRTYAIETYLSSKKSVDSLQRKIILGKNDTCFNLLKAIKSVRKQEILSDYLFSVHPRVYGTGAAVVYDSTLTYAKVCCEKQGTVFFIPTFYKGFYFERRSVDKNKAKEWYSKFIEDFKLSRTSYPFLQVELAIQSLAQLQLEDNEFDKALKTNVLDIFLYTKYFKQPEANIDKISSNELQKSKKKLFYSYGVRGQIYLQRYKHSANGGKRKSDLDSAYLFLNLVDKLLFPQIISSDNDAVLRYLWELGAKVYEDAIEATFYAYTSGNAPHKDTCIENAFRFLEHRKAFLMYQSLRNYTRTDYTSAERRMMETISTCNSDLEVLYDGDIARNSGAIETSLSLRAKMYAQLRKTMPDFFADSTVIHTVRAVNNYLSDNHAALLHYAMSDSALFILGLNGHGHAPVFVKVGVGRERLAKKTTNFTRLISDESCRHLATAAYNGQYLAASNNLFRDLLKPVLNGLPPNTQQLIVSADGLLSFLPMEALLLPNIAWDTSDYRKAPFLINYLNVIYTPAWKIYRHQHKPNQIYVDGNLKALAMAYGLRDKVFLKQAMAVKQFFSSTTLDTGRYCNSLRFERSSPSHDVVFLAIHASTGLDTADNKLYFTTDTMKGKTLSRLHLKAKLTILSACETALGQDNPAEGTFSITRSFLQAGSQSVVASVWKIPTGTSAVLLERFWANLKTQPVETALFNAKKSFLTDPPEAQYAHPFYWAGLILQR